MPEIEIKLELDPALRAALMRTPALSRKRGKRHALLAIYFDTPDGELAERRMALRLRRDGNRWVQTFKAGGGAAGGLHARDEWEEGTRGPVLDLAKLAGSPLADLPDSATLHERLVEVFRVQVERISWDLQSGDARIEAALDVGVVRRGDVTSPIAELELEVKSGSRDAVFDVACSLVARVPMRPSAVSKAMRGYRLVRGQPLAPAKAEPRELDRAWTPAESARKSLAAALEQLQANEEGVLASDDPEFIHQLRVALRRIRSVLRAHRKALEPGVEDAVREDLQWITRVAGEVRDLDVLAEETLVAMARDGAEADADFERRLEARRRAARTRLREAIGSSRYGLLVLTLSRWLASTPKHAPAQRIPLTRFASKLVKKRHRRLVGNAKDFADMEPAARHQVRIEAKRLRYTVQGFESLFPHDAVAAYLKCLSDLQDDLGTANDAVVALQLLHSLDPPESLLQFARGWLAAKTEVALDPIAGHFKALEAAAPFWKD